MLSPAQNIPTILVVFGATGDLMARKIVPALDHLHQADELPERFHVVGVARRPFSDDGFRALIQRSCDAPLTPDFLQRFVYQQAQFDEATDYLRLKHRLNELDAEWGLCTNKLYYLSVTPDLYETIFEHLANSGLATGCGPEAGGWTRVLVEKPFGRDAVTAEKLDERLGKLFNENQIYRIDHYLAKEMLQTILTFRFSNLLLEPAWDNRSIERIKVTLHETLGVETRGDFYDATGALRDVGQNHLLQMLALVTMDHPGSYDADAIRLKRAELLNRLPVMSDKMIRQRTRRGQYAGYLETEGVDPSSNTETFFRIETHLDHPRWSGVPIALEAGKRMARTKKEIVVTFKHPDPCLCPPGQGHAARNQVTFQIEPEERVTIAFWSKKPGLAFANEPRTFEFFPRTVSDSRVQEYEKLLLDAIAGDVSLFVSTAEIRAMWRFIDPIVDGWKKNLVPLEPYT